MATFATCARCQERKPVSDFSPNVRHASGVATNCRACAAALTRERRQRDPERARRNERRKRLKQTYGISEADYDRMLAKQGGRCAICRARYADGEGGRLHVDHDHATGVVRGLLCAACNTGLGCFSDSTMALLAAVAYLEVGRG